MIRKIRFKKIILFLLMLSVVFVPIATSNMEPISAGATEDSLQKQINEKKASITATANRKKELENKIVALKSEKADAVRDKQLYDEMISVIEDEIRITEELIIDYEALIAQEEIAIEDAQAEYEKSYALLLEMIKFAYEEGDANYLGMLFKAESFTDFLSRIDIISNMIEYNKNVINSVQQSKENLETRKMVYEEAVTQHTERSELLAENKTEVKGWLSDAKAKIVKAEREIEENEALQAEIDKDSINIQSEITRLSKELHALQESKNVYVGGTFKYPVTPKYKNAVSSGFGWRKSPITGRS